MAKKELKEVKEDVKNNVKTAEVTKEKTAEKKTVSAAKMNIYEKMAAITNEMGVIAKNLNVGVPGRQYKAVSERDVLDAVKELEEKYRVYSYPAIRTEEPITDGAMVGKVALRITTVYRFVNLDKPTEVIETTSYGDGVDTLDKAPGKAMTYADKYALMKAYKISTGDDPDQEASPDAENPKKTTTKATATVKPIAQEQIDRINSLIDEERKARMLKAYKKNALADFNENEAATIIRKLENEIERNKKKNEAETTAKEEVKTE